ncbi:hypothetical protein B0H10DRAFT_1952491 [Mycena sp. CBHHK59/15]|nr:hypothetical protein B0H10DRAFT_1952491 [Mycena sp. CBHHK59/15]
MAGPDNSPFRREGNNFHGLAQIKIQIIVGDTIQTLVAQLDNLQVQLQDQGHLLAVLEMETEKHIKIAVREEVISHLLFSFILAVGLVLVLLRLQTKPKRKFRCQKGLNDRERLKIVCIFVEVLHKKLSFSRDLFKGVPTLLLRICVCSCNRCWSQRSLIVQSCNNLFNEDRIQFFQEHRDRLSISDLRIFRSFLIEPVEMGVREVFQSRKKKGKSSTTSEPADAAKPARVTVPAVKKRLGTVYTVLLEWEICHFIKYLRKLVTSAKFLRKLVTSRTFLSSTTTTINPRDIPDALPTQAFRAQQRHPHQRSTPSHFKSPDSNIMNSRATAPFNKMCSVHSKRLNDLADDGYMQKVSIPSDATSAEIVASVEREFNEHHITHVVDHGFRLLRVRPILKKSGVVKKGKAPLLRPLKGVSEVNLVNWERCLANTNVRNAGKGFKNLIFIALNPAGPNGRPESPFWRLDEDLESAHGSDSDAGDPEAAATGSKAKRGRVSDSGSDSNNDSDNHTAKKSKDIHMASDEDRKKAKAEKPEKSNAEKQRKAKAKAVPVDDSDSDDSSDTGDKGKGKAILTDNDGSDDATSDGGKEPDNELSDDPDTSGRAHSKEWKPLSLKLHIASANKSKTEVAGRRRDQGGTVGTQGA